MRKFLGALTVVLALGASAAALPGCSAAWWQQVTSNPAAEVQAFESTIQVALNAAQVAWPEIEAAIPQADQAEAQQQYENAVASVGTAENALNSAVTAAEDAQTTPANLTGLMQAVSDAVADVISIVNTYTQSPSASDAGTVSVSPKVALTLSASANVANLKAAYKSLNHWHVTLKAVY